MKRQMGFTLVEIAIVLVVIGLLLGGVLKGQELVLNSRVRSAVNEFNNVTSAMFIYQDRYRQIPGDDITASTRFGTAATNGSGNREIEGTWEIETAGSETAIFWHHLRNDGLVSGAKSNTDTSSFMRPTNSFDGLVGVQSAADANILGFAGGIFICQSNIPAKGARIIDNKIDDNKADSGGIRAAVLPTNGALPTATSGDYADTKVYVLCKEM